MDINEVSKASGMAASTLRYYEQKGLIQSIGRAGLRRVFAENILERLSLISLASKASLSLDEIRTLFTASGTKINRTLLLDKADELDKKIKELTSMRDGLRHAAACPAENHFECPKFLRLLKIAGKKNKIETQLYKAAAIKKGSAGSILKQGVKNKLKQNQIKAKQ